ncbi:dentin sialophosphoprotein-like [Argopecten irradians]|uniref:dentin sialophosphoprotein-like n=1 Tax=Argopecten irradians TaxID=31199 RepID=UPI00371CE62D
MTTTLEDGVAASAAESQSNEVSVDIKVNGDIDMPQTEVSANLEIGNQNEQEIVVETVSGQEQEESKNVATSDEATDIVTSNDSKEGNTESDDTKKKDSIETTDINVVPEDKEEKDAKSSLNGNVEITSALEDDVAASSTEFQSSEESVNIKVVGEIDLPQSEVTGSLEIETDVCKEREESSTEVETVKSTDGQSDKGDIDDNAENDKTDRNESSVEASMETIPPLGVGIVASSSELLLNQEAVDIKDKGEIELPHTDVTGSLEIETDVCKERENSPTEVETAKSTDEQSEKDDMHDDTKIDNTDKNDSTETTDTSNGSLDKEETDAKYSVEASMANIPSLGVGVVATSAELLSNKEEADIKVEGEIEMPHTEVTGTLEIENQNEREIVVETVTEQEQEESKNVATSDEATNIETTNDSKEDNTESDDTKKTDSIETTDISHAPEDMEETNSKFSIDANVEMTTTLEDGVAASAAESQSNEVSVDMKVDGEIDMPQTEVSANLEIANQNEQEIVVETVSGQEQEESKNVATSDEATDIETTNDSNEREESSTEVETVKSTDGQSDKDDIDDNAESDKTDRNDSSVEASMETIPSLGVDVPTSSAELLSNQEAVDIKVEEEVELPHTNVTGTLEIETDDSKEREESQTEVETAKSNDDQSENDDINDSTIIDNTDKNDSTETTDISNESLDNEETDAKYSVEASMETIPPLGVGVAASSSELLSNQEAVDIKVEGEIELPHTDVTGTLEIETDEARKEKNPQTEVETAKSNDDQSENDDINDNTIIDNTDKNDSTETTDTSNESLDKEETDAKSSVEASMANIPSLGMGVAATSAELLSNQEEVDIKVEGEIELPHTEVTGTLEIENQNEQEIVVETVLGQEQEESKNVATSNEATDIVTTNDSKEDNIESDDIKKADSIETTDISHAPEDKEETDSKSSIDANVEMTTTLEDGVAASAAESQSNEVSVDIKVNGDIDMPQTEVSANLEIENQNEQEIVVETVSGQEQEESKNVATSNEATDIETSNDSKEDNTENDDTKKKDSIETTDMNAVPEDKEEKDAKSSFNGNIEITFRLGR